MLFWIDLINRRWNGFHILKNTGDDKVTLSSLNTLYLDDDEEYNALATTRQYVNGFVYVGF